MSSAFKCGGCEKLLEGTAQAHAGLVVSHAIAVNACRMHTAITYTDRDELGFEADELCETCAVKLWLAFKELAQ
jgi:hypothetical protein